MLFTTILDLSTSIQVFKYFDEGLVQIGIHVRQQYQQSCMHMVVKGYFL